VNVGQYVHFSDGVDYGVFKVTVISGNTLTLENVDGDTSGTTIGIGGTLSPAGVKGEPGVDGATPTLNPAVLPHIATPSAPSSGNTSLYAKSDNKLYFLPAGGAETEVGSGALPSPIRAKAVLDTDKTVPNITNYFVPFVSGGIKFDTSSFWSNSNPTRFTIPSNGVYILFYGVSFSQNGSGARDMLIRKNGTTLLDGGNRPVPSSSAVSILGNSSMHQFVANDYIELLVYQNSGGNLTLYGESTALYVAAYLSILKVA
jgi:hypothetical protein